MINNGRPFTNECKHNDSRLITECTDEQQAILKKWIYNNFVPSKSICSQTSYNLKHRFEDDTGIYLTNNQFKDAMLIFGGYEPVNENRLNWEYRVRFKREMEIEVNGELHTFKEWSQITGISVITLRYRYSKGATAEEFLKPVRREDDDE